MALRWPVKRPLTVALNDLVMCASAAVGLPSDVYEQSSATWAVLS